MIRENFVRAGLAFSGLTALACSSGPPPDFAPSPALVAQLREIEIVPRAGSVCPGSRIDARYFGVTHDGRRIPFATYYDGDNPPELHVVMLSRRSPNAVPHGNGTWRADPDPLATAMEGFELRVALSADPSIQGSIQLAPDYSCMQHQFAFSGANGTRGGAGHHGPDVQVRLAILSSPFAERLLVAELLVESAPPEYFLFDADRISAADWINVVSSGGRGGRGVRGDRGVQGAPGEGGCPGGRGGPGGAGGVGGPGGPGGDGGRITVVVPADDPYLAGMVSAENPGGRPGQGGIGGQGGPGGPGGTSGQRRCSTPGEAGPEGPVGPEGRPGEEGRRGPPMEIVEVPGLEVFGARPHPWLARLLEYSRTD